MTARNPGVDLPACDPAVFRAPAVFVMDLPAEDAEAWVKLVADSSGQRVDWHYMGGRAVVRALGDLQLVHDSIDELLPELEQLQDKIKPGYRHYRFVDWLAGRN